MKTVGNSQHAGASLWMTEYGDLDQTGLIEWQFAWRSARRLLGMLEDGFHAAIAWDAFDNFHEHDGLWATYRLLATDRSTWTYAPKKRYFAAKQVFRFVRPGWRRVAVVPLAREAKNAYAEWQDPAENTGVFGLSPDGARLLLESRGEILSVPAEKESGASYNLTRT